MSAGLIDRQTFDQLAELALRSSRAEHIFVTLSDHAGGTTRFANNQVTQNVNTRRQSLSVTAAFGQRHGTASTTDLSAQAIRDVVRRAEQIARVSPPDPEYLPPLGPQRHPSWDTFRPETAEAGPDRRLTTAHQAISACQAAELQGAGIVAAYVEAQGLAASSGLRAYEQRSEASFSLTASGPDSSGWVSAAHRSFDALDVPGRTRQAIDKALHSRAPRELPPGRYTVILEPPAVAGLVAPLWFAADAKSYYRQTSALSGKLGQRIIDPRLSLQNRPDHPALLGDGFNGFGLPSDRAVWIDRGVLRRLHYDRFTAREHAAEPTYALDAPCLSGAEPALRTVDELIAASERAILVTNFWYIRSVNPTDLTLTGMTRDGTFLVEQGQIAGGLINFRFHDSPLRALNALEAFTDPLEAITQERGKMLLPALRIADFNFSSVTRF